MNLVQETWRYPLVELLTAVVFLAVLVMILGANFFVLKLKPQTLWPYYVGLLVALGLNVLVPLDFFLGMNRTLQVLASDVLVFAPILFHDEILAVTPAERLSSPR